MKIQNQQNLKSNNEKMILEIIRNNNEKDISQADIVKATKMSPTSISRIVENLITKGLQLQGGFCEFPANSFDPRLFSIGQHSCEHP